MRHAHALQNGRFGRRTPLRNSISWCRMVPHGAPWTEHTSPLPRARVSFPWLSGGACALAQVTAKTSYEKAGKLLGSNPAWEAMEDTTRRPSERTEQTEGERQWQSQSCQSHPAGKMTWGKWVRCSLDAMGHGFDYFLRVLCLICRGHARNNAHNTLFELSTSSARSAPHEVQVLFSV